jgi:hypothetical protein
VCTISREESEAVIDRFLEQHPGFEDLGRVQLVPHRDGTDGFFIARLRREGDSRGPRRRSGEASRDPRGRSSEAGAARSPEAGADTSSTVP